MNVSAINAPQIKSPSINKGINIASRSALTDGVCDLRIIAVNIAIREMLL